jgi:hypothetical protein
MPPPPSLSGVPEAGAPDPLAAEQATEATALWAVGDWDGAQQTLQRLEAALPNDARVSARRGQRRVCVCACTCAVWQWRPRVLGCDTATLARPRRSSLLPVACTLWAVACAQVQLNLQVVSHYAERGQLDDLAGGLAAWLVSAC